MRAAPVERQQVERQLLDQGWHAVRIPKVEGDNMWSIYNMTKWCEHTLGLGRQEPGMIGLGLGDVWYVFNWFGYYNFYFEHGKDATAFALRWL